jgi:hypothetical protein
MFKFKIIVDGRLQHTRPKFCRGIYLHMKRSTNTKKNRPGAQKLPQGVGSGEGLYEPLTPAKCKAQTQQQT